MCQSFVLLSLPIKDESCCISIEIQLKVSPSSLWAHYFHNLIPREKGQCLTCTNYGDEITTVRPCLVLNSHLVLSQSLNGVEALPDPGVLLSDAPSFFGNCLSV